ncbi:PAS domain S-box protein [Leptospira sp. 2 VSF19]|uniref:histidine kinase n=1 Tax=Leptospira soteropolitanensis TaxID=2950025 RepID=A0AAW5VP75_9LEPT|nr:PAS domain S-box protein [Leptospira soteropolitanensis]MCW7493900.1 PAS domain S-box protein [Leptospira soteropolitanensis]MCW7501494.1 PAS domain S-box protein [Leptospira soteropolitanensis]MCW7523743.1 PAS domain S-box protein [Leptospira soteropolitanensis]MCW7527607.1 PAS domain S-box protein [Leptospira soteropolitanensis]MCW7531461.1 PAS domain S-box protein [Leptospira soteropolitanensis]
MQTNLEASGMIEFFKVLPNLFSGGVYLTDPKSGKILFSNDFFKNNLGCHRSNEDCLESDLLQWVAEEDKANFREQFLYPNKHFERETIQGDYRFRMPNEILVRWFQFEKRKVNIPKMDSQLQIVFVRDVTNEKTNEINIVEQIQFFLGLFENASVGMALQDWEGGYFRINPRFTEITGYSFQNLTDLNIKRIKGEPISEEEMEYFGFFKEGVEESRLTRKDGRRISVYRRISAFRNSQGKPDFYYVFLDDVTEKKQIESYQLHSQKMETIGSLATNIAHDLNNYLQPIHVFSQLGEEQIKLGKFEESKILEYLEKIRMGADNARSMIHRIIKYSKVKDEDSSAKIEISSVIESTIPLVNAGLPKNVEAQFDFYKSPLYTKIDAVRFSKILCELTSGGLLVWDDRKRGLVRIQTSSADEFKVLVSMEFTGLSLPSLSGLNTLDFVNFGEEEFQWTGMHLINRYVKNWGGEFYIEKPEPMTVLIHIYLPLEEGQILLGAKKTNEENKPKDVWSVISEKEIWIVEDDEAASEAICFVLSQKQIFPKIFRTANSALENLKNIVPDFILSDYRMREINGLSLIRKIKKVNPDLSAVLYTGNMEGLDSEELDAEGILVRSKPISVDELYETILLSFGFL